MKTARLMALFLLILSLSPAHPAAHAQNEQSSGGRKVVNKVVPAYPHLARDMNLVGTVRLEVSVASNGVAKSIQVKGGNPLLAQSAQEAVHNWRWEKADHETFETLEFNFKP